MKSDNGRPTNASPATRSVGSLQFILRAFSSRNYRLYFFGQLVSMMGTWLTLVATSWLVYRLASKSMPHSEARVLGVVNFAAQIPILVMAPFGGVWVDRFNKHRIVVITQTLSMLESFALAFLALSHVIQIWQIVALNAFQGLVNAFDVPARQSFVVDMVERREDLPNAIALSSSIVHAARLIGPAIAGFLIAHFGEGYCFLFDGFSYLGVIIALLMMHVRPHVRPVGRKHVLHEFKDGVVYAFGFAPIRALLLLTACTSILAMGLSTLMPLFASQILHGDERVFSWLVGSSGVGAFIGTIYLASRRSVLGLGGVMVIANTTLGLGMLGFSQSHYLPLSMVLLFVTGGSLVVQMAAANTVLQTIVDDEKRGRLMSLFSMCFMGMGPFGSLLAGEMGTRLGPPRTLLIAGCVCLAAGAMFGVVLRKLRHLVHPIYVKRGILPEVAEGVQTTEAAAMTGQE